MPGGVGSDWSASPADGGRLATAMTEHGVEHAVVVQAVGVYGYDCRCAIETVEADPERFALVVAVDMDGPDPAADLVALAGSTTVAGVRAFAVGRAGTAWLDDGRGDGAVGRGRRSRLTVVPTIFTERLAALRALLEQHPATTVALDHCAFPDMAAPERRDDLLALADLPSLHLKVTSHNLDQPGDPAALPRAARRRASAPTASPGARTIRNTRPSTTRGWSRSPAAPAATSTRPSATPSSTRRVVASGSPRAA